MCGRYYDFFPLVVLVYFCDRLRRGLDAMLAVILYQVFCILKLAPDTRFLAALLLSLVIVSLIVQAIRILTCIYL